MKQEIEARFTQNLARVESLLALYPAGGSGRRHVASVDVLRAAVVFLHATLEDLIRGLLEWKLPSAPASAFDDVTLVGQKPRTKFAVADLVAHRGKSVDELLRESVLAHLLESNFNHPGELASALTKIGFPETLLDPHRDQLGPMMARRHWIVHRADRNDQGGSGQHHARSLGQATVQTWLDVVRAFGQDVLVAC
jgi:hypothetical protein